MPDKTGSHLETDAPRIVNLAHIHRTHLEFFNYITISSHAPRFFCNYVPGRMEQYRLKTSGRFNLIIGGQRGQRNDFYIIPYEKASSSFTPDTLRISNKPGQRRQRWLFSISAHTLVIRGDEREARLDISQFYGNEEALLQLLQ